MEKVLNLMDTIINKVESLPLYDDVPGKDAKVELFEVVSILQQAKKVVERYKNEEISKYTNN